MLKIVGKRGGKIYQLEMNDRERVALGIPGDPQPYAVVKRRGDHYDIKGVVDSPIAEVEGYALNPDMWFRMYDGCHLNIADREFIVRITDNEQAPAKDK